MSTLLRSRASVVWLVLVVVTVVSWALGTDHDLGLGQELAALSMLVLAVVKIGLIGLNFMELRHAPSWLRLIFTAYCGALLTLLGSLYLIGVA